MWLWFGSIELYIHTVQLVIHATIAQISVHVLIIIYFSSQCNYRYLFTPHHACLSKYFNRFTQFQSPIVLQRFICFSVSLYLLLTLLLIVKGNIHLGLLSFLMLFSINYLCQSMWTSHQFPTIGTNINLVMGNHTRFVS